MLARVISDHTSTRAWSAFHWDSPASLRRRGGADRHWGYYLNHGSDAKAGRLSSLAVATLLAWQLRQAEEAEAAAETWQTEGHVYTMEDDLGLDPAYVTRFFQLAQGLGRSCRT